MTQPGIDFQYESFPEIPENLRQVDWTYIAFYDYDKPFSEAEEAFQRLRDAARQLYMDKPFAYLHFLRAVESSLMTLAVVTRQPVSKCLEILRRRLDLEYGQYEIVSKASQAVVLADYFVECGEIELAGAILRAEREQLNSHAEICRNELAEVTGRLDRWGFGDSGDTDSGDSGDDSGGDDSGDTNRY